MMLSRLKSLYYFYCLYANGGECRLSASVAAVVCIMSCAYLSALHRECDAAYTTLRIYFACVGSIAALKQYLASD